MSSSPYDNDRAVLDFEASCMQICGDDDRCVGGFESTSVLALGRRKFESTIINIVGTCIVIRICYARLVLIINVCCLKNVLLSFSLFSTLFHT